ncbi:FecCD family ABC transporter permease [Priestia taiwanensis]|uniref:Iron ABC transporter permease n=1 Tax=Priestia taiwanensis TaxID=1347902 RepID=A0A917AKW6_9BACI|nr:iron ABC transporter permease [Priestia taiwanensis]MBM7362025.1 iron complex transport system permease protein [Priestia taiwanensis]GGE58857.1 iron ABC transporter permease [Priestia taiwanensis]
MINTLKRPSIVMTTLVTLIIAVFFIGVNTGTIPISPMEVIRTLMGEGSPKHEIVLFNLRLPRMIIAILIGAGLAVSGAILQGIAKNPLADPGIMGINAGAGLGVVAYIYFVFGSSKVEGFYSIFAMPLSAIAGAFVTALIIYALAWKQGVTPIRLILVGIAVAAGIGAINTVLSLKLSNSSFMYATIWLTGSLWGTTWHFVFALLPWVLILVPYAIWKSRYLNILNLGDPLAIGIGVRVERERMKLLMVSVGLAGACVAAGGGISFIGLMAPHIARQIVGSKHQVLLPTAALIGSLLLITADFLARNILPSGELPVGIIITFVGAPYFLYLLTKARA